MTTRIMVIDDEALIGQLLSYQLSGAGYEALVYQSGPDALQRLSYDQPDLVLLDVMMPGVSGWDLCRQIRSCSAVPVIMLTAKSGDDDVVMGLNCGADDYVGKPFSEQQLIARIEAVLRRSRSAGRAGATPPRATAPALGPAVPARRAPRPAGARAAATERRMPPRGAAQPAAPPPPAAPAPRPLLPPSLPRLGPTLADARRQRRLSLHDAERACGVRWEFLQAIEQEQFGYMPRAQLRAALRAYSDLLGIDLQPYMGHRRSRPRRSLPASLALSAVIVLLIVLTLVVIVL